MILNLPNIPFPVLAVLCGLVASRQSSTSMHNCSNSILIAKTLYSNTQSGTMSEYCTLGMHNSLDYCLEGSAIS